MIGALGRWGLHQFRLVVDAQAPTVIPIINGPGGSIALALSENG
jgi:hypothetical protein